RRGRRVRRRASAPGGSGPSPGSASPGPTPSRRPGLRSSTPPASRSGWGSTPTAGSRPARPTGQSMGWASTRPARGPRGRRRSGALPSARYYGAVVSSAIPARYDRRVERDVIQSTPGVRVEAMPELAHAAPMDVAERFRHLPGLVLLESARPGRNARWTYLAADPVAVIEAPSAGA